MPPTPSDADDYSPSSTVITFDHPVPLLRGPLRAGSLEDPTAGPFVLAFRDAQSWTSAYKACQAKLVSQCEAAARIGCAISASSNCKRPWWRNFLTGAKTDFAEREKCEEREMAACFEAARSNCGKFAKEKCLPAFRDARIAIKDRKVDWREAAELILWVSLTLSAAERSIGLGLIGLDRLGTWNELKDRYDVSNCRGSDLVGATSSEF